LTEQEPWKVAKDPSQKERLATILYLVAEMLRIIAVLFYPIMPKASEILWKSLGAQAALGDISDQLVLNTFEFGKLPAGSLTSKGEALFPQLIDDE
ncbi:MAG: methionine--tRNA ligase, partial [Candidatus Nanopelagicales bacterium]